MPTEIGLLRRAWKRLFGNKAWFTRDTPEKDQYGCQECQLMVKLCGLLDKQFDLSGRVAMPAPTLPKSEEEALLFIQQQEAAMAEERKLMQEEI